MQFPCKMPGFQLFLHSQPVHTLVTRGLIGMYVWPKPIAITIGSLSLVEEALRQENSYPRFLLGIDSVEIKYSYCELCTRLARAHGFLFQPHVYSIVWRFTGFDNDGKDMDILVKLMQLSQQMFWCLTIVTASLFYLVTAYFTANETRVKRGKKVKNNW